MNKTVAETAAKRICRPGKPTVPCGELRKCVPDDTGATALVQPFPTEGQLFDNLDLSKADLEERRIGWLPGKVRSYKMTSVALDEAELLQQEGSGPNYQGGCLTLCTCQCVFRAEKKNSEEWLDDWWIAGFTIPNYCGRIWLFYLAQIEQVYASQDELWQALPGQLRQAKSTRRNRLGDAYQPNPSSSCLDAWDAAHYHPPMVCHSHHVTAADDGWKNDIEFFHPTFKRHSVLLVAKPELTFIWQTPLLFLNEHPRTKTWASVGALLSTVRMNNGK